MNTGAPGQKSKLVESFLLLSLFRLPLRPPSAWPGRCKPRGQVALPSSAGSCGDSGGRSVLVSPGQSWSSWSVPNPPDTDGRQPRTPRRRHQTFLSRDNAGVNPEDAAARPSPPPAGTRRRQGTPGTVVPEGMPCTPISSGWAVPAHTWGHRLLPAASREPEPLWPSPRGRGGARGPLVVPLTA